MAVVEEENVDIWSRLRGERVMKMGV